METDKIEINMEELIKIVYGDMSGDETGELINKYENSAKKTLNSISHEALITREKFTKAKFAHAIDPIRKDYPIWWWDFESEKIECKENYLEPKGHELKYTGFNFEQLEVLLLSDPPGKLSNAFCIHLTRSSDHIRFTSEMEETDELFEGEDVFDFVKYLVWGDQNILEIRSSFPANSWGGVCELQLLLIDGCKDAKFKKQLLIQFDQFLEVYYKQFWKFPVITRSIDNSAYHMAKLPGGSKGVPLLQSDLEHNPIVDMNPEKLHSKIAPRLKECLPLMARHAFMPRLEEVCRDLPYFEFAYFNNNEEISVNKVMHGVVKENVPTITLMAWNNDCKFNNNEDALDLGRSLDIDTYSIKKTQRLDTNQIPRKRIIAAEKHKARDINYWVIIGFLLYFFSGVTAQYCNFPGGDVCNNFPNCTSTYVIVDVPVEFTALGICSEWIYNEFEQVPLGEPTPVPPSGNVTNYNCYFSGFESVSCYQTCVMTNAGTCDGDSVYCYNYNCTTPADCYCNHTIWSEYLNQANVTLYSLGMMLPTQISYPVLTNTINSHNIKQNTPNDVIASAYREEITLTNLIDEQLTCNVIKSDWTNQVLLGNKTTIKVLVPLQFMLTDEYAYIICIDKQGNQKAFIQLYMNAEFICRSSNCIICASALESFWCMSRSQKFFVVISWILFLLAILIAFFGLCWIVATCGVGATKGGKMILCLPCTIWNLKIFVLIRGYMKKIGMKILDLFKPMKKTEEMTD